MNLNVSTAEADSNNRWPTPFISYDDKIAHVYRYFQMTHSSTVFAGSARAFPASDEQRAAHRMRRQQGGKVEIHIHEESGIGTKSCSAATAQRLLHRVTIKGRYLLPG